MSASGALRCELGCSLRERTTRAVVSVLHRAARTRCPRQCASHRFGTVPAKASKLQQRQFSQPQTCSVFTACNDLQSGYSSLLLMNSSDASSAVQAHRGVVVTRLVSYWRQVVAWIRSHWQTLVAKLPGHHQTRLEAATTQLHGAWHAFQHLAGQVSARDLARTAEHSAVPGALLLAAETRCATCFV